MTTIRTRIAPSPTGDGAHIGLARTALFNWLFARHHGGAFVLRSEDTDLKRSRPEYEAAIQRDLQWLGLEWDEFHRQSDRRARHREAAQALLEAGAAYPCYCTPAELEAQQKRAAEAKQSYVYEGRCRLLAERIAEGDAEAKRTQEALEAEGRAPALRFKLQDYARQGDGWVALPKPAFREEVEEDGAIVVRDSIKGEARYELINPTRSPNGAVISDFVILRADGVPTYNFAVVVDDLDMGITHVIRGDEHLNNTPRQLLLYRALSAEPPRFAHLPMILDQDKKKLSKRRSQVGAFVDHYRRQGFLPEALVNFLARLGWSHGDQEVFSIEELVATFSLQAVGSSAAVFDDEKLYWLNQHHLKQGDPARLAELLRAQLVRDGVLSEAQANAWSTKALAELVALFRERARTLGELAQAARPLLVDDLEYDEVGVEKFITPEAVALLRGYAEALSRQADFAPESLESFSRDYLESRGKKLKHLAQPARLALTGGTVGAGLFETLAFLGKARALKRLRAAVDLWEKLG